MRIFPLLLTAGVVIAGVGIAFQLFFAIGGAMTLADLASYLVTLTGLGLGFAGYAGTEEELIAFRAREEQADAQFRSEHS